MSGGWGGDPRLVLAGTTDPSAGAGLAASIGTLYERNNAGVGEIWKKTGAANNAWTIVGGGATADHGALLSNTGAPNAAIPEQGTQTYVFPSLATTERDTDGFRTAAPGGFTFPVGLPMFTVPAGLGGIYEVGFSFWIDVTNAALTDVRAFAGVEPDNPGLVTFWDISLGMFVSGAAKQPMAVPNHWYMVLGASIVTPLVAGATVGPQITLKTTGAAQAGTLGWAAMWLQKVA